MYICSICHGINHAKRLHCQYCETIPAPYSLTGKPCRQNEWYKFIQVVSAYGCERQQSRKASRSYFRTVPLDYYAYGERE